MKPLSIDLRQRIVQAYDAKEGSKQQIAERFAVSISSVKKLINQRDKLGTIEPQYQNVGRKPAFNNEYLQQLDDLVAHQCDITLNENKLYFAGVINCSHQAIANALERLCWDYKKKHYERLNRIEKI
jgi:transposase